MRRLERRRRSWTAAARSTSRRGGVWTTASVGRSEHRVDTKSSGSSDQAKLLVGQARGEPSQRLGGTEREPGGRGTIDHRRVRVRADR